MKTPASMPASRNIAANKLGMRSLPKIVLFTGFAVLLARPMELCLSLVDYIMQVGVWCNFSVLSHSAWSFLFFEHQTGLQLYQCRGPILLDAAHFCCVRSDKYTWAGSVDHLLWLVIVPLH